MQIDTTAPATMAKFGEMVGITRQAVGELCEREILPRGGTYDEWFKRYCKNLREVAAGRVQAGEFTLEKERAKLAREQRERIALQNAVTRKEYAPVMVLELSLARACSQMAGILEAIPAQIKRRFPLITTKQLDLVRGELNKARNSMAVAKVNLEDVPGLDTDGDFERDADA